MPYTIRHTLMDLSSLIGGVIGGVLGGSALAKFFLDSAKDRWMESVKAQSAAELEKLKDSLLSTQKALQARLDQGTHVTQAQYDLELSSYRELWAVMSELRERWRSLFVPYGFQLEGKENPWLAGALEEASRAVFAAHDAAVIVCGRLAPFYAKQIQTAVRATTMESHAFLLKLNEWNSSSPQPSPNAPESRLQAIVESVEGTSSLSQGAALEGHTFMLKVDDWKHGSSVPTVEEATARLQAIVEGVERIDGLIRDRLSSLRLL